MPSGANIDFLHLDSGDHGICSRPSLSLCCRLLEPHRPTYALKQAVMQPSNEFINSLAVLTPLSTPSAPHSQKQEIVRLSNKFVRNRDDQLLLHCYAHPTIPLHFCTYRSRTLCGSATSL